MAGTGAEVALMPKQAAPVRAARHPRRVAPAESSGGPSGPPRCCAPAEGGRRKARGAKKRELTLKSVSQTVRVDIRKLDNLMNIVGELGIARAGLIADPRRASRPTSTQTKLARELHHELRALRRRLDELQAGILEVRMVPLGQVFDKLSRVVRKISRDAGKEIRLTISGADTELDKLIVEELSDPLMHVMRNCIDHGIEKPEARAGSASPTSGRSPSAPSSAAITSSSRSRTTAPASTSASWCGKRRRARARRCQTQARELSRREVLNLMFLPGLRTKDVADELSGRGVGMDVVKTNIARLSGIIDVESERGIGTRLTITLPITLAIIQALIIRAAGRTFAVPLNSRARVAARDAGGRAHHRAARGHERCAGRRCRWRAWSGCFALERENLEGVPPRQFVVVVGLAQHRIGLARRRAARAGGHRHQVARPRAAQASTASPAPPSSAARRRCSCSTWRRSSKRRSAPAGRLMASASAKRTTAVGPFATEETYLRRADDRRAQAAAGRAHVRRRRRDLRHRDPGHPRDHQAARDHRGAARAALSCSASSPCAAGDAGRRFAAAPPSRRGDR